MFKYFTERAKKAILYAQEEARNMGHNYIGTEHLLLGVLRDEDGVPYQVLSTMGIDVDVIRNAVKQLIGVGGGVTYYELPFTARAKRVLELAMSEAQMMGYGYVDSEHLLLGLLRENDGIAAQILSDLGADLNTVRKEVYKMLHEEKKGGGRTKAPGKGKGKTPLLEKFGIDLTALAYQNRLDPVIGRDKEIKRVIQILSRRTKNNPVLVGDPGVGKTAVVEGLAQRIAEGNVPELLKNKRIIQLNLANLVAGTKYRGEFEERMRLILKEIMESKDVIIFIDEVHTVIGAGAADGAIDASNILKPSLARGDFQIIGATTLDEYRRYIEKDAALERRFQPIMVDEPSIEDSILMLKGLRDKYEAHHGVRITDEAIEAAVRLSARYISDRFLPDKAVDLIDEAAARVKLETTFEPDEVRELEKELEQLTKEKEAAVNRQEFEKAATLRDRERELKAEIERLKQDWTSKKNKEEPCVTEDDVAAVVSEWVGIPVTRLKEEEVERLKHMEEILHERVIGQDEAISAVARAIRRSRSGIRDPKKPIGSFLFLGPTGVGKTELARTLADFLFGDETAMIRLDMSEYMEKHTVSRLIGAPPGYVGYQRGGQLTEAVRKKPYSVVLFDEIEKAHPDVFNVLLQIMDDGRLTDGKGRTVDFKNTVIIMTSNVGAEYIKSQIRVGFGVGSDVSYEDMKDMIMDEVKKTFRPEFLNRLDDIIIFRPLTEEDVKKIIDIMLKRVNERVKEQGISIEVDDGVKDLIVKEGFDPVYGARPLQRAIQRLIEDPLSDLLLEGRFKEGDTVEVHTSEDGSASFRKKGGE